MNERLLRRSICPLPSRRFPAAVWTAVGADSSETPDRFDSLEPTVLDARISEAVNRQLAHLSDEALVALAARSEQSALAELYDRYGRTAYGLALRVLRDQALAEDAVQEAFLAVWRTASRFMPERGKASSWILTLVHRRAVDAVRREQRRRADSLELAAEPSVEGVDEDAFLRLQRERVQAALRHLPDAQREALELAYYGGFTQSELAERLGQPLGTIKSRMFGGLARMRELLGEPGTETSWMPTT
ncbi:MAG: sigma-70 family RNA polymerase sigma factor [Actinobacteria bacterium]|nr:MAG: sigma-70 family RNA polymerase sigma factor [Actinomycetota bacterium]